MKEEGKAQFLPVAPAVLAHRQQAPGGGFMVAARTRYGCPGMTYERPADHVAAPPGGRNAAAR